MTSDSSDKGLESTTCTAWHCKVLLACAKAWEASLTAAGVYYEQGLLNEAIQTYQDAIAREANFPEAYNNLGNALREANRMEEAMQCYTMCIQLQLRTPQIGQAARVANVAPPSSAYQQAQRLSVAYNNLGGILKMQASVVPMMNAPDHRALLKGRTREHVSQFHFFLMEGSILLWCSAEMFQSVVYSYRHRLLKIQERQ